MNTLLILLALSAAPEIGPLKPTTPLVELGTIRSGPKLTKELEFTNSSDAGDIRITSVETGCNCLKSEIQPKTLPPGQKAKLGLVLNTLTPSIGAVAWRITVHYTHNEQARSAVVTLQGKLEREISVTPPAIAISTQGEVQQTLTVTDRRGTPLKVRIVQSTTDYLKTLTREPVATEGCQTQEILVQLSSELKPGSYDEMLTLITDDPTCRELIVPVRIVKQNANDITVAPSSLTIRLNTKQSETSGVMQLRAGGKTLSISKVECTTPGVSFRYSEGGGALVALRAIVNHEKAGASGTAEAVVTLREPAGAKVTVLLSWYTP